MLQHVWTKETRLKIVKWMVEQYALDGVENGLPARTIRKFPYAFSCCQCQFQFNKSFPDFEKTGLNSWKL